MEEGLIRLASFNSNASSPKLWAFLLSFGLHGSYFLVVVAGFGPLHSNEQMEMKVEGKNDRKWPDFNASWCYIAHYLICL